MTKNLSNFTHTDKACARFVHCVVWPRHPCPGPTTAKSGPRRCTSRAKIVFAPVLVPHYGPWFARRLGAEAISFWVTAIGRSVSQQAAQLGTAPSTPLYPGIVHSWPIFPLPVFSSRANVTLSRLFWRYQRACDPTLTHSGGKSAVREAVMLSFGSGLYRPIEAK